METTKKSQIVGIKNAGIVIICCFIIAVCIYHFLLGNPSNFMNNDPNNHPLPGNFLGTIYKGGGSPLHGLSSGRERTCDGSRPL